MESKEINDLAVESALLKGLASKDYAQLRRLRELETMISPPKLTNKGNG